MEVYIKIEDVVRGLQCFDPEKNGLTPHQCHRRMRSLSPAPDSLRRNSSTQRFPSRPRSNASANDPFVSSDNLSQYSQYSSRGRSPVHQSPDGNVLMPGDYARQAKTLRRREPSPLARKLAAEGTKNVTPRRSKKPSRRELNQTCDRPPKWDASLRQSDEKKCEKKNSRQEDWDELQKSPVAQRQKQIHHDAKSELRQIRQRIHLVNDIAQVKSEVVAKSTAPSQSKVKIDASKLLEQPIPPMIKSNSYVELSTADYNVIIKDFSPIKINKLGERMFSMVLETKQKNSLDGMIKTKRENIRVKLQIDSSLCGKIDSSNPFAIIPNIYNVSFPVSTPPQLWRQLVQNFRKFS